MTALVAVYPEPGDKPTARVHHTHVHIRLDGTGMHTIGLVPPMTVQDRLDYLLALGDAVYEAVDALYLRAHMDAEGDAEAHRVGGTPFATETYGGKS